MILNFPGPKNTEFYDGGILTNHRNPKKNQVKESPAHLNIPTPTPAPDHGGPVACPGGPVACLGGPVACLGGSLGAP